MRSGEADLLASGGRDVSDQYEGRDETCPVSTGKGGGAGLGGGVGQRRALGRGRHETDELEQQPARALHPLPRDAARPISTG